MTGQPGASGERFEAFTTAAEERWLAGDGPEPRPAADRLPPRAGLLIPRAGAGHWWVEDLRTVRLWVDADGRLQLRDRKRRTRCLVEPGVVHGCWWVVDAAASAVGLPVAPAGWLVLLGSIGPVLALRLADWEPPLLDPDQPETLRAAGAEGLARALRSDLESVADHQGAANRIGQVPTAAVFTLDRPLPRRLSATFLGTPLVILAAYWVLLLAVSKSAATAVAMIALAGAALAYDLAPLAWRRRRTRRLPQLLQQWWPAQPAGRRRPGAGIGVLDGPLGPELVLADGYGFEAWFPGPALGGAASLVVDDDKSSRRWSLVLHDRDQRMLLPLPLRDWAGREGAQQSLEAAVPTMGLLVSRATRGVVRAYGGRTLSRKTSSTTDLLSNVAATWINGVMTPLFWVSAEVGGASTAVANSWFWLGAGLLLLRTALRWRRVL